MATLLTNTPFEPASSTVSVGAVARALDGEQRRQPAVKVLARTEPVTERAERHPVSRKFLYQQAAKGAQALEQAVDPAAVDDEEVLFYLPVTKTWLRQVVLGLLLLCHRSFRGDGVFPRSAGSSHRRYPILRPVQLKLELLRRNDVIVIRKAINKE